MHYLSLEQILTLHGMVTAQSGGSAGIRDMGALESAIAQPQMTFGRDDLYPSLAEKTAALGHALVMNHPTGQMERASLAEWIGQHMVKHRGGEPA